MSTNKPASVHLELSELLPEDLVKVVELIDDLGDNVITYTINRGGKPRPSVAYRNSPKGSKPYAVVLESDITESEEPVPVALDIEPTTTDIQLNQNVKDDSEDLKSNIQEFL